ncbi:hypothetical protein ACS0TY_015480 [Phlomoides rotata]
MAMSPVSPDLSSPNRRSGIPVFFVVLFVAVVVSCLFLQRAADFGFSPGSHLFPIFYGGGPPASDSEKYSLEKVLKDASMQDNTVILTTLNEAWAAPNSIIDLFLESFRIGERTRWLLNHLVIVSLDQKAFSRYYLRMMWRRIDFLRSVLEMGYNFVFTDADVMWFRDPFPHFHPDADFQIACDHFSGRSDDIENKPNGGFKFVRSNYRSIEFYKFWHSAHKLYTGLHDQDVLNRIKNDSFITEMGLQLRFLDTTYFGGFCEPSEDITQVCTMHANCCFGLNSKLHDLRLLLEDWRFFLSLPPGSNTFGWRVPQNCSLDVLFLDVQQPEPPRTKILNA